MKLDTKNHNTVAAIATPPGRGGIGIIRISGPNALKIGSIIFKSSRSSFTGFHTHRLHHGRVTDSDGSTLDEALAVFMPGPGSFTGEDVLELHCHGSPVLLGQILERVLSLGADPAGPGEFTRRAFLNGRLDLTQAEAVAEIIDAPGRLALTQARNRLSGLLGRRVRELRTGLEQLRAQICLAIDFPDDEIETAAPDTMLGQVDTVMAELRSLLDSHNRTRRCTQGALTVLAGAVNAGKSSLLNAILGRERAIVTPLPGTTRDYIEELVDLDGLPVRLVDTAGLRATDDAIELIGLERSRQLIAEADLILLVLDGAASERSAADTRPESPVYPPERTLIVRNKADLPDFEPRDAPGYDTIHVSARTGLGLEELLKQIRIRLLPAAAADNLAPNLRQAKAIESAMTELTAFARAIRTGLSHDLLSVHLEHACIALAEITGEIAAEDILNLVFGKFCIGK